MMKNIYVVGRPLDLYRTQAFVSTLMEYRYDFNLSISYFTVTSKAQGLSKIIRKVIIWGVNYIQAFIEVIKADYVYFPAMSLYQSSYSRVIFAFARFIRKRCICDFYISCYDTDVLDRKNISEDTSDAKSLKKLDLKQQISFKCIYLTNTELNRYTKLCSLTPSHNALVIPLTVRKRGDSILPYFNHNTESFTIMWWGSFIPLHGLDRIIESVKLVLQEDKNVFFYILGNSEEKSQPFKEIVRKYGLEDNIIIKNDYSFYNGKLEPFIIQNCDLAMGAFGLSDKAKSVVLNKCIEAISMKLPVLTQKSFAFAEFFDDNNKSIFYSNNDIKEIAKTILEIKKMKSEDVYDRIQACYEIYLNMFSEGATKDYYRKLFVSLK